MTAVVVGTRGRPGDDPAQPERVPCSEQRACQPVGSTWTTMRRAQSGQYRGGSYSARRRQGSWPGSAAGRPQDEQNTG